MVYPINVASDDRNIQTWPAAAVTTFLKKFRTPAMIVPIIPRSAAAALPAILPRGLARALSLFFNQSLSLLGCFGGEPAALSSAVPVKTEMTVLCDFEW